MPAVQPHNPGTNQSAGSVSRSGIMINHYLLPVPNMLEFDRPLPDPTTEEFDRELLALLHSASPAQLSLERALRQGSAVIAGSASWTLLGRETDAGGVTVRVGVFFTSQIAGCSCADDPNPADTLNEFSEAIIKIAPDRYSFEIRYL